MDKKKRKRFFSSNLMTKRKKDLFLKAGMSGFLCTCNGNEKQCIRESYNLLNEYADNLYGEEKITEENKKALDDDNDEMDEFREEIQALKSSNSGKDRRFQALDTGIANCIFIKTNVADPVSLSRTIMTDLAEKKQSKARFLLRMVPIQITCKAYINDILNTAVSLFDIYFIGEPQTYGIVFTKRCNSNIERDDVIKKLAEMIQQRNSNHKVNLSHPDITIVVEVMKSICGLAVISGYNQLCKFNLSQICATSKCDTKDSSKSLPDKGNENTEVKSESSMANNGVMNN